MLWCVLFMTRPAVLKPHLERQPQQPQPCGKGPDAPLDPTRDCCVASCVRAATCARACGWLARHTLEDPPPASRPRPRPQGPALPRPHLDDPPAEARHVRQLLQRLCVGIVVLRELRLHNLRGAKGAVRQERAEVSQTPAQSERTGPQATPQKATAPPHHQRVRAEGAEPEPFSVPPTSRARPHLRPLATRPGTCNCSAVKDVRARLAGLG